jgi:hypothetical protein
MACYFIVHHHGGKIEATSAEGRGTTFALLPTDPNSAPLRKVRSFFKKSGNEVAWEEFGCWSELLRRRRSQRRLFEGPK